MRKLLRARQKESSVLSLSLALDQLLSHVHAPIILALAVIVSPSITDSTPDIHGVQQPILLCWQYVSHAHSLTHSLTH